MPTAFASQSVMTLPGAALTGAVSSSASNIHSRFNSINCSLAGLAMKLISAGLQSRFEDHIEWCFGGPSDVAEPACGDDLTQFRLAGLGAERGTDLLRQGRRHADHRRGAVIEPADWVQIVFQPVARH